MKALWEKIKQHPFMVAGGIFVVGIIFILIRASRGGSSTTAVDTSGLTQSDVAAGVALQSAQLQSQTQIQQATIAADAQAQHDAMTLSIAQLQANSVDNNNIIAGNVSLAQIQAQQETTDTANSLNAKVAMQTLSTQQAEQQNQLTALTQINTQSLLTQQTINEQNNQLQQTINERQIDEQDIENQRNYQLENNLLTVLQGQHGG